MHGSEIQYLSSGKLPSESSGKLPTPDDFDRLVLYMNFQLLGLAQLFAPSFTRSAPSALQCE